MGGSPSRLKSLTNDPDGCRTFGAVKIATFNGHALRRSPANSTPNPSHTRSRTPSHVRHAFPPTNSLAVFRNTELWPLLDSFSRS